ncbi:hypothetical protein GIB67_002668 [Kingdonia uniflora]|uniref:Uncharacterized protein n=1 Tax=Kingdonia uniflora TaxID=39325 RepID=A0A7J7LJV5_9MAGN|nr:hypothetical protein GIB67_002668 [Kingdonia uniflora]
MALSPSKTKTSYHTRSISLPAQSHPLTLRVEEQIRRLRSSEAASISSSSSSILQNLSGLKDLYDCVDDLLRLPLTQQAIAHERSDKCVNDVLEGSLRILEVCGTTRDLISQIRECVLDLQSSFRRNKREVSDVVNGYMITRKKVNKVILKCLGDMKRNKNISSGLKKDQDIVAIICILREAEDITVSMFESLLSLISRPTIQSKPRGWPLVSKLTGTRQAAHNREEAKFSEMEKVDTALSNFTAQKSHKGNEVQDAQKQLAALESSIQDLESELDCFYRSSIKTRVSLLNILSN